ncbi:MAG: PqqD family protein [Oscillospiraceae bacterium]|nr:PqqD family protein [Oscillospiraceae bacterium]
MKLNSGFIAHNDGDDKLLVSTGASNFSGLVRSNSTAGFIITCLENDTTEEAIVEKMLAQYDAPREVITADVKKIIEQLRGIGAIDE